MSDTLIENSGPYIALSKDKIDLNLEELVQLACSTGASGAKAISSSDILVENKLANFCHTPRCENYGLSPSCPPHVAGPSAFRKLQAMIHHAIVARIVVPSAALFSNERREIMRLLHEILAGVEQAAVKMGYFHSQAFAGGSCKNIFCHEHAACRILFEGGECRYPQSARPSMSGFGINVSELMKVCGWPANINTREAESGPGAMTWVAGLTLIG